MTLLWEVLSLYMFQYGQKSKEGIEENYMTALNSFNLVLFGNEIKLFEDWISETQFKIEYL